MVDRQKRHWLEIAEYVSLASTLLAAIAAVISRQLIYVGLTAPLTLAAFCNLVNRGRSQSLYQQQTNSLLADVRSVVESLDQQVNILPAQARFRGALGSGEEEIRANPSSINTPPDTVKSPSLPENITPQIDRLITERVEQSARIWAIQINQYLEQIQPYNYQLVLDRSGSRAVLLEALAQTQQRLIIVSPWLTRSSIDEEVLQRFSQVLERRVRIDIGWGHLPDTGLTKPAIMSRQQLLEAVAKNGKSWQYEAIEELGELEKRYPQQFRLKLIFTNEKFLVSINPDATPEFGDLAMLGSHDILAGSRESGEREVGLKTNDPRIVADLTARFDQAVNYDLAYNHGGNGSKNLAELGDAIAAYQYLSVNQSKDPTAYHNLAIALLSQGCHQEAIAIYRKLLELEPNNPVTYTSLGNALLEVGDRTAAFTAYQRVLEIDPNYTYAYNNMGKVLEDEGKLREALDIYRQALHQPEQLGKPASAHTLAYNNAGVVLAKLGKLKEAIIEFQQAIELDPTYTEARNNLQKAQFLLGSM